MKILRLLNNISRHELFKFMIAWYKKAFFIKNIDDALILSKKTIERKKKRDGFSKYRIKV